MRARTRLDGVIAAVTVGIAILAPATGATVMVNGDQQFGTRDGAGFNITYVTAR